MIEAEEREMIDNVLHLEETTVREIMVPRVDVVAVEETTSPRELVATITGAGHSRLPVYRETIDQIVGVLYAKDLLPFVIGTTEELPLAKLVRPAYVVPESKRVDDLLTELRRNRVHIAIVADEYGGTAGLVTIEDILEEIVGEIQDEYDVEVPLVERIGAGELIVDGRLPLEDVAEAFGLEFAEDDYGTVAGFVQHHLGRLPVEGDRLDAEGLGVEVLDVEGRRLRRLRLTRLGDRSVDAAGANGSAPEPAEPRQTGDGAEPAADDARS
jgi:CBS domain containing-hemolysin-like protein